MGVVEAATTGGSSFGELLRLEAFINPNFLETFSVNPSLTARGKWKFKPAMFSSKWSIQFLEQRFIIWLGIPFIGPLNLLAS